MYWTESLFITSHHFDFPSNTLMACVLAMVSFFLAFAIRCHANLQHARVLHQSPQKMFPCSLAKETQKLCINIFFWPAKERSCRPVFNLASGMKNMKSKINLNG
jgi:hypothetical protein